MADRNIARHLWLLADRFPNQMAVYQPVSSGLLKAKTTYEPITYRELRRRTESALANLYHMGFVAGDRVVLMVPPSLEFFALTFALLRAEMVPVFIDPGMGIKPLGRCLAESEPTGFIGSPKAHLARILFGWEKGRAFKKLQAWGPKVFPGVKALDMKMAAADQNNLGQTADSTQAAVLFTSGSTGIPKGAVYTHGNFNAQVECLKQTYGIKPGEVDLCTFPLFALFAPALGMTAVIPQMDFTKPAKVNPEKIYRAIQTFGVQNMFGSPALLQRLSEIGTAGDSRLGSLKRVISAGAPVSPRLLQKMAEILPSQAEVFTPYGATEALPVASIGSKMILEETAVKTATGAGVCVGKPMAGLEVKVIPIDDQPIANWSDRLTLPTHKVGEIVVKGPQVTGAYLGRPKANLQAKIKDGDAIYHRMGDLGYFDDQGNLWFCGRKSHRLETAQGQMFTVNCESIFNQHSEVYRCALVGRGARGSNQPVLFVEPFRELKPQEQQTLLEELRQIAADHEDTKQITEFKLVKQLPTDTRHNAKIFREKLKHQLDQERAP